MYEGEWKNGLFNGSGIYTWPDKSIFTGQFKD
ncbi:MAG: molecular chaperone Tir, partial [Flammeovirgaceae bacterium]